MYAYTTFLLLAFSTSLSNAQNIFSALHSKEIREYKYGRPQQIVETNTFYSSNNTQVDKNIKTFDNAGMPFTEERYDETGKINAKLTYINDTINHLCLRRIFERWTNERYSKETAIYAYDNQNFLIRITDVDANGNATMVSELVNNDKGNPIELHLFDGRGRSFGIEKATYFYDRNIAVTTVFSNDGRNLSSDSLEIDFNRTDSSGNYNEHGDAISYSSRNLDGSRTLFESEYIYDNMGNCIDEKIYKVTVRNNGKKKRSIDRHFEKQINYR